MIKNIKKIGFQKIKVDFINEGKLMSKEYNTQILENNDEVIIKGDDFIKAGATISLLQMIVNMQPVKLFN